MDLANDIAKRPGTKIQLASVQSSTRVHFLQQCNVDILIANMEYNRQRGEILDRVPTPYYRVGGTAIIPKSSGITKCEDPRGRPVCISQGSSYTRPVVERYGALPRAFPGASQSLPALRGGSCVAAVHDAAPPLHPLQQRDPEWRDYRPIQPALEPASSDFAIHAPAGEVA